MKVNTINKKNYIYDFKINISLVSYIRKGKYSPATPTSTPTTPPHSRYPPWILKCAALESSGQIASSYYWKQDQGDQCRSPGFQFRFRFWLEGIFWFCNISVKTTFQFLWHFSFSDISVLVIFQFWEHFSCFEISVMVTF